MWSFFYDSRHKRADFTIVARFYLSKVQLEGVYEITGLILCSIVRQDSSAARSLRSAAPFAWDPADTLSNGCNRRATLKTARHCGRRRVRHRFEFLSPWREKLGQVEGLSELI